MINSIGIAVAKPVRRSKVAYISRINETQLH